jgi:putative lipoprotein (rSAM/lipoprotein system)
MKINKVFSKGMNWVLAGIISMLGFAGCEDKYGMTEYGSPHADYTIKGVVVNKATGKPVKGIRVGYSPEFWATAMYGVIPAPYQPKNRVHVTTDAKGEFKLTDRFHDGEFQTVNDKPVLPVYVEDIDGEENGSFQPEYLQVDITEAERGGKPKNWYAGEYSINVNVELTETGENQ